MIHEDLKYLLRHGWTLIGTNLVQSPDGDIQTTDISKAARLWRIKLHIREFFLKCRVDNSGEITYDDNK